MCPGSSSSSSIPEKRKPQSKHNKTKWSFCGQQAVRSRGAGGGAGLLVLLAAGQAAYKIHKISALKSAAGQKLKT